MTAARCRCAASTEVQMKKGCLIAFGAAVGLVVVVLLFVFWLTRSAVSSADNFLALIGQDKIEAAYQSSSATLRAQQSQESFAQSVRGLGLTDYASVFWSTREVKRRPRPSRGLGQDARGRQDSAHDGTRERDRKSTAQPNPKLVWGRSYCDGVGASECLGTPVCNQSITTTWRDPNNRTHGSVDFPTGTTHCL